MKNYSPDFFNFISSHKGADPNSLRLSMKKDRFNFDIEEAVTQIECRNKAQVKLKKFIENPCFIFPDGLSYEQSSHQAIAFFHASLAAKDEKLLDMTGGLGIDAFSFSDKGVNVTVIELEKRKADILELNASSFNLKNFKVINADSIEYLRNTEQHFTSIFIDPARRDNMLKRVYNLRDCSPDVISNQDLLLNKADRILIKASPLLDISQTIKDFPMLTTIRAIGVKGECKEILIELSRKNENSVPLVEAINLDNEGSIINKFSVKRSFSFMKQENIIPLSEKKDLVPGIYILEPSPMVMKLAPWSSICEMFSAKKLSINSHIFISNTLPVNFPGRVTKFEKTLKKQDRKSFVGFPASVVSRNYPLSSDEIRKSFKLKEGDQNFIYATRIGEQPILIHTVTI